MRARFTNDFLGNEMMGNFLQTLRTQRWDDHRYYHHSRINQSLHFVSALSFLTAYALLFIDPVLSALMGWLVVIIGWIAATAIGHIPLPLPWRRRASGVAASQEDAPVVE